MAFAKRMSVKTKLSLIAVMTAAFSLAACDKPPSATNTQEYRNGKSGATPQSVQDLKTNDPVNYPKPKE